MKSLCRHLFCILLSLYASHTFAHIDWSEINGTNCSARKCQVSPLSLSSGDTINVVYNVTVVHNASVSVVYIKDGETHVLKSGLPETPGLNSATVTLPNIECDECALNVMAAGYSGLATVVLQQADADPVPVDGNAAPILLLDIVQDGKDVTWVDARAGIVWVKAKVMDMNSDDTHSYDWANTDNRLVDQSLEDDSVLSFDPSVLTEGEYNIRLMVSDSGEPVLSDSLSVNLMVSAGPKESEGNTVVPTDTTPKKKGGSIDWMFLFFAMASGLYCAALYFYGIKKDKA